MVGTLGRSGWSWRQRLTQKRLALDEGVVEEESELFFSGGKDDWQKFWALKGRVVVLPRTIYHVA